MDSKKALDRRDFIKAAGAMGALSDGVRADFQLNWRRPRKKPLNPPHRKSRLQNL